MKKIITALIAVVSVFFLGCNDKTKNSNEKNDSVGILNSELVNQLNSYNRGLFDSKGIVYDIKSNGDVALITTRCRGREIGAADVAGGLRGAWAGFKCGSLASPSGAIAGAVVGAILNASAASLLTWWVTGGREGDINSAVGALINSDKLYDAEVMYQINCQLPEAKIDSLMRISQVNWAGEKGKEIDCFEAVGLENEALEEIGARHNAILEGIISGESVTALEDQSLTAVDVEKQIVADARFKAEYIETVNASLDGDIFERAKDIEISDVAATVIELFMDVYSSYPDTMSDVDAVVSFYVSNVASSAELTIDEKRSILIGLVVAAYTARYWDSAQV